MKVFSNNVLRAVLFALSIPSAIILGWLAGYDAGQAGFATFVMIFSYLVVGPILFGLVFPYPLISATILNLVMTIAYMGSTYRGPIISFTWKDENRAMMPVFILLLFFALAFLPLSLAAQRFRQWAIGRYFRENKRGLR